MQKGGGVIMDDLQHNPVSQVPPPSPPCVDHMLCRKHFSLLNQSRLSGPTVWGLGFRDPSLSLGTRPRHPSGASVASPRTLVFLLFLFCLPEAE